MTRPVLGIDLGTTYSCVAVLDENGRAEVLPNQESDLTTPSVVFFEESGKAVVGKFAKNELNNESSRVVDLIKRHMGQEGFTVSVAGKERYPQEISALILKQVAEDALNVLGVEVPGSGPLADVVITVPAYFGAAERQATRDAGEMADLNVLNIINEPTAAAIAYGLISAGDDRSVLVYDLGGGTFDVTVISVAKSEIRVVATGGDHHLGGADWDTKLADLICARFAELHEGQDPRTDLEAAGSVELLAEEAKKALTRRDSYGGTVVAHGHRAKIEISRAEFEESTADLLGRTLDFTRDVLGHAREKGVRAIDELLLVGGMSHSPAVKQRLVEEFPDLPAPHLADPDQIVAKGAALFAASSVAEADGSATVAGLPGRALLPKIVDVTSKGYGVAAVRDRRNAPDELLVAWLVRPNDEIPASPRETFYTIADGQEAVQVSVYESTTDVLSDDPEDHLQLVEGRLAGLPAGKPAGQPVEVSFNLEADGILRISAVAGNGKKLTLEAKISGLVPEEVKRAPLPAIQR
jgi:molecular chaperone DnaK